MVGHTHGTPEGFGHEHGSGVYGNADGSYFINWYKGSRIIFAINHVEDTMTSTLTWQVIRTCCLLGRIPDCLQGTSHSRRAYGEKAE
jgi:hypothetical protein